MTKEQQAVYDEFISKSPSDESDFFFIHLVDEIIRLRNLLEHERKDNVALSILWSRISEAKSQMIDILKDALAHYGVDVEPVFPKKTSEN